MRIMQIDERYTDGRTNHSTEHLMLPDETWNDALLRVRYTHGGHRSFQVTDTEGPDGETLVVTVYPAVHTVAVTVREVEPLGTLDVGAMDVDTHIEIPPAGFGAFINRPGTDPIQIVLSREAEGAPLTLRVIDHSLGRPMEMFRTEV